MAKVLAICGKICSGKTYYSNKIKETENAVILSCDEVASTLFNNDLGDKHDEMVQKVKEYLLNKSLDIISAGTNVILDWGFWSVQERTSVKDFYNLNGITNEWHYIDVADDVWFKNIEERNKQILEGNGGSNYYMDEKLMNKLLSKWESPTREEIDVWYNLNR